MTGSGDNMDTDLASLARRMANVLDEIEAHTEDKKQISAEVKAAGFTPKVFNQAVKEERKGAEYQAKQLQLEMELDTYRKELGLPRTFEAAQKAVLDEMGEMPDSKSTAKINAKRDVAKPQSH